MEQIPVEWARVVIPSGALPAPHFCYSPVVRAGPMAYISGMVALDPQLGTLVAGDAGQQTARILSNLQGLLDEQGWRVSQIVLARIYCVDFSSFGLVNQAWEAFFTGHEPPARTSLGVSSLPLGALVEIEFQLVVGAGVASTTGV